MVLSNKESSLVHVFFFMNREKKRTDFFLNKKKTVIARLNETNKMGNAVNKFMLKTIVSNSKATGAAMSRITDATFWYVYDQSLEHLDGWKDKFVRFVLTPTWCPIPNYKDYMYGVSSKDMHFTLSYLATSFYGKCLNMLHLNTEWQSTEAMFDSFRKWDLHIARTDSFMTFDGLAKFYSRSSDLMDILTRQGNYFIIDTMFLNDVEYKAGVRKLGCVARFVLTSDGFVFVDLYHNNMTYTKDSTFTLDVLFALRALYGGTSVIRTFLTHAVGIHFLASARITRATQEHMLGTAVEEVLKPCMFQTVNGLARAARTLFAKEGFFHAFGPFTYSGLCTLIANYIRSHRTLTTEFETMTENGFQNLWQLTDQELTCLPFRSLNVWIQHITSHVSQYVEAAMPYDLVLNGKEERWFQQAVERKFDSKENIKQLISYMYFLQVRHTFMADVLLQPVLFAYSYTLPDDQTKEYKYSYNNKWDHFMKIVVDLSTSFSWIKMQTNLAYTLSHPVCKDIWHRFYAQLPLLTIDPRLPLIAPANINSSTGL
jgi:hypothetical protein